MIWQWVLLVLLLVSSGLVSGSETALFGLSRLELRSFRTGSGTFKRQAWQLMQRPTRLLMTVLIANTAINVLFFAISFVIFERIGHQHPLAASGGGLVALLAIIMFGEILPKAVARAHPVRFAPLVTPGIYVLQTLLWPLRIVLRIVLVEPLTRLLTTAQAEPDEVSSEELRALVEMSAHRGVIDTAESRMLQEIISLPGISVRAVMKPRVDIIALPVHADPQEARAKLREVRLTKLPVYGRDLDDIVGLVYARDLHLRQEEPLGRLVRPVRYVPEQINLPQLIEHFRLTRSQLAIVVDEYGGTAGLVAVKDVLELMVGELGGAAGPGEPATEVIDDNTYRLAGNLSVRDWAQRFGPGGSAGRSLLTSGVETVAGLVLAKLGRLPHTGDTVQIHNLTLTVERLVGRRIDRILLRRVNEPEPGDETLREGRP